jgi:uncharacterized coiled-coil protein SlyX
MRWGLIAAMLALLLVGAAAGYGLGYMTLKDEVSSLSSELAEAQETISRYEEEIAALRAQVSDLEGERGILKEEITELRWMLNETNEYVTRLQAEYEVLLTVLKNRTLRNPMWDELKTFLMMDETDEMEYKPGVFDCTGFAIKLRDNAGMLGLRCAFVEIEFAEGGGHALNAFLTVDRGLIYVDVVEKDAVAYVQVGQPYGMIDLEAVRYRYIDCSGDPARFWGTLNYTTHPDPFSYDYYIEYRRRVEFYRESVEAYNEAVEEYNRGIRRYTYSQLQSWYENLKALSEELGAIYEPMGTVRSIEAYWN